MWTWSRSHLPQSGRMEGITHQMPVARGRHSILHKTPEDLVASLPMKCGHEGLEEWRELFSPGSHKQQEQEQLSDSGQGATRFFVRMPSSLSAPQNTRSYQRVTSTSLSILCHRPLVNQNSKVLWTSGSSPRTFFSLATVSSLCSHCLGEAVTLGVSCVLADRTHHYHYLPFFF